LQIIYWCFQGRPRPRFASPSAAASGILVVAASGKAGMTAGMPPPALTGGIDAGTLPAAAASGNGGGREAGCAAEADAGNPALPAVAGLLLRDGGKLLKLGSLPSVLPSAISFM